MMSKMFFNLTCNCFSVQMFLFVWRSEHVGLGLGCHSRCGSRRASTNCLNVLNRHFLECESALSWQSAKTPGGGWPPCQEECLCLTIHIATALPSTVITRMHIHPCAHSPLSGSSVNESCALDTEQIHGKHGLMAFFWVLSSAVFHFVRSQNGYEGFVFAALLSDLCHSVCRNLLDVSQSFGILARNIAHQLLASSRQNQP